VGLAGLIRRPARLTPEAMRNAKPLRNPDVEETEQDGALTLRGPAAVRGLLGKLLTRSASGQIMKQYELEEVGAFVWTHIDGKRTFQSLSKLLQTTYKMNRLEAEASLAAFLQMLSERGLVTLMVKGRK